MLVQRVGTLALQGGSPRFDSQALKGSLSSQEVPIRSGGEEIELAVGIEIYELFSHL